jgi:UDP-N-acetylglucosamine 2-epimerase (non-hydrolysing)
MRFKIAHVEAGLRNFDKTLPEEINRTTTDICSDYLFCPTQTAVDNLKMENLTKGVYLTGDVMVDVMNAHKEIAAKSDILEKLSLTPRNYILVTVHRAGNTDNRQNLESIARALIDLSRSGETLVFPAHPRTVKLLSAYGLMDDLKTTARIIEPLGYLDFMKLMDRAKKIVTDSGGIQKEAYILKVPCITMMESTSWVETLEDGWNTLSGLNTENIVKCVREFQPGKKYSNIFGDGACRKIAGIIQGN